MTQGERPTRSGQQDIIDEVVWNQLPGFWSKVMDPSDRDALSALYESYFSVLDAEYIRLHEIDKSKAIHTCPVWSQRRWLRLDLNRYHELRAWLRFLSGDLPGVQSGAKRSDDVAKCTDDAPSHARHWHINFPFVVSTAADPERRTIELGLPISAALTEVYKMSEDASGRLVGTRLLPETGFEVLPNQTGLRIVKASPGDLFEVRVGFDLSGSSYQALAPTVVHAPRMLSNNVAQIPADMNTGYPIHALIVRNAPAGSDQRITLTNTEDFQTRREFIPFTGDSNGAQYGRSGQLVLPPGTIIGERDVLLLFGLHIGEMRFMHNHATEMWTVSANNANPSGQRTLHPTVYIPPSIFSDGTMFTQERQLFIDGKLISPQDYQYDPISNEIVLKTPLVFSDSVTVQLQYESQQQGTTTAMEAMHLHFSCMIAKARTEQEWRRYDTGLESDDDTDTQGSFDSFGTTNIVYVDTLVDLASLEVYVNGVLQRPGTSYVATHDGARTRLTFAINIEEKPILIVYQRTAAVYQYGAYDLQAGAYGFTQESLNRVLFDLDSLAKSFESAFGSSISNLSALVQAAHTAAAGGNPFLTLFFDEFPEYGALPIDADNQPFAAAIMRDLESSDTQLIDIPFMVDHVRDPTIRYQAGVDYEVVDGGISSARDLLAPRGEDDEEPGVWWCPVVLLDERLLAKSFGALLNDIDASSESYRDRLAANLRLRFTGPTVDAVQKAASVMLGSPVFTQDSVVQRVFDRRTGWSVTIVDDAGTRQQVETLPEGSRLPTVNQVMIPGQTVSQPLVHSGTLAALDYWKDNALHVMDDWRGSKIGAKAGDQLRLQLFDPRDPTAEPVWALFTIKALSTTDTAFGVRTVVTLDYSSALAPTTSSVFQIIRNAGPPYAAFEGFVASVVPETEKVLQTELEEFVLDPRLGLAHYVGDAVFRGDPVYQSLATFYDDGVRPGWHWINAADARRAWESRQARTGETRYATVSSGSNGFGLMSLSPVSPQPVRGTEVWFEPQAGEGRRFTVVGLRGAQHLIYPDPGETLSGEVTLTVSAISEDQRARQFYEVSARNTEGARPSATLKHTITVNADAILLSHGENFPNAGVLHIFPAQGGVVEVTYFGRRGNEFYDLAWPGTFPALTSPDGAVNRRIPGGTRVEAVWAFIDKRLNPAFVDLVQARVKRDYSTVSGKAVVDERNADEYYALLRSSAAVLETNAASQPRPLIKALRDTLPSGSTLVVKTRHVIVDDYEAQVSEGIFAEDTAWQWVPFTTVYSSPQGTVTNQRLEIASNLLSCAIRVDITDANTAEAPTVVWSVRTIRGTPAGVRLSDPTGVSTRLSGLEAGGEYRLTCEITSATGYSRSEYLTVVATGAP